MDRSVTGNIENFVFLPDLLSLLFSHFLSFFFQWHFVIYTFARLSICRCNKHAASHCAVWFVVWRSWQTRLLCVCGSYSGFVREPIMMVWDLLMRWRAVPFITAFPYSPDLSGYYKHYGAPGWTDCIPPQAVSVQLICKGWITKKIQCCFLAGEHKTWKKMSFFFPWTA